MFHSVTALVVNAPKLGNEQQQTGEASRLHGDTPSRIGRRQRGRGQEKSKLRTPSSFTAVLFETPLVTTLRD
jgi:hypothetical protein